MDDAITHDTYVYRFWTGSGSNTAELTFFERDRAAIVFTSDWMGVRKEQSTFSCTVHPLTPTHGLVRVLTIEGQDQQKLYRAVPFPAKGEESDLSVEPDTEILYEYLILQAAEEHVQVDRVVLEISQMGYAGWNETFDLLLLLRILKNVSEEARAHKIATTLDKLEFRRMEPE